MSKLLANLLDQPERFVTRSIKKLEERNGFPSEDARLLAENSQAVRQKVADLGLDPDDTTGEELYQALLAKFNTDSAMFDKALGIIPGSSAHERLEKASLLVKELVQSDDLWVLKYAAAKKLLRQRQPKKLMKQLNYRSLESLLKRENIAEIYLQLPFVESGSWQKAFAKDASQLKTTDYELRAPEIVTLDQNHWAAFKPGKAVSSNLIGAVGMSPSKRTESAPVLTLSLLLLDGLENLTHSEATGSIGHINPALIWWEQAKNLVASCQGETVSLNYKDVAQNHLKNTKYPKREASNARASLWSTLAARYHSQEAQIEETLVAAEEQAETKVKASAPKNLALEYAEAIANEF